MVRILRRDQKIREEGNWQAEQSREGKGRAWHVWVWIDGMGWDGMSVLLNYTSLNFSLTLSLLLTLTLSLFLFLIWIIHIIEFPWFSESLSIRNLKAELTAGIDGRAGKLIETQNLQATHTEQRISQCTYWSERTLLFIYQSIIRSLFIFFWSFIFFLFVFVFLRCWSSTLSHHLLSPISHLLFPLY